MKTVIIIFCFITFLNLKGKTQEKYNLITTSVPFLNIVPDAQSMGFGDIGVVAADIYYQPGLMQNPSLLAKNKAAAEIFFSYRPWLRNYVKDLYLTNLCGYFSKNKFAVGFSWKYFSLGNISQTNSGQFIDDHKPFEYIAGLKFAYSVTEKFSAGTSLNFIHSDLDAGDSNISIHPANAISIDIGVDYRNTLTINDLNNLRIDLGSSITNIGNKISYSDNSESNFLPATLRLGTMLTINHNFNKNNALSIDFAYQAQKLLVPTPPIYDDSTRTSIVKGKDPNVSVFKGIVQSFYDAPYGYKEELHEIVHYFGFETRLTIKNVVNIALRCGRMNEHKYKGNRKINMFGAGLSISGFFLDIGFIQKNDKYLLSQVDNRDSRTFTAGYRFKFKK